MSAIHTSFILMCILSSLITLEENTHNSLHLSQITETSPQQCQLVSHTTLSAVILTL
jgi:hypothetical protein